MEKLGASRAEKIIPDHSRPPSENPVFEPVERADTIDEY